MRRFCWMGAAAIAVAAVLAFTAGAEANCGTCGSGGSASARSGAAPAGGHCSVNDESRNPMKVEGATVNVTEIRGGVRIDVVGADTATTRKIRTAARKMRECIESCRRQGEEEGAGHAH